MILFYTLSISFITIFFVLETLSVEDIYKKLTIGFGITFLIISFSINLYIECRTEKKPYMSGFEAWIDRVDFIVHEHMSKYNIINYTEDDEYIVSNYLLALTMRLEKNATKEEIMDELSFTSDLLKNKGTYINIILLYNIYEDASDVTTDLYKNEIISFFCSLEKSRINRNNRIINNRINNRINNGENNHENNNENDFEDFLINTINREIA